MRQAGISGLVRRRRGRTTLRVPGVRVARSRRAPVPAGRCERAVGGRRHLRAHVGGLGLPRRGPGRLQSADRRLEHGRPHARRAGRRRARDGRRAPPARPGAGPSQRSGQPCTSRWRSAGRRRRGIARSMGPKGDRYDNAVAEIFFATLKKELVNRRSWPTRRGLMSRSLSTSRRSTTARADTPRSVTSRPRSWRKALSGTTVRVSPLRGSTDQETK
jgi:hypothetical protein